MISLPPPLHFLNCFHRFNENSLKYSAESRKVVGRAWIFLMICLFTIFVLFKDNTVILHTQLPLFLVTSAHQLQLPIAPLKLYAIFHYARRRLSRLRSLRNMPVLRGDLLPFQMRGSLSPQAGALEMIGAIRDAPTMPLPPYGSACRRRAHIGRCRRRRLIEVSSILRYRPERPDDDAVVEMNGIFFIDKLL